MQQVEFKLNLQTHLLVPQIHLSPRAALCGKAQESKIPEKKKKLHSFTYVSQRLLRAD